MSHKTGFIIIIVLAVIILGLAAVFFWPENQQSPQNGENIPTGNEGIEIVSPKPNETIASPMTVKGFVKGNGWTGFEGQVGLVRLFDSNNKELALGILTATENWMQLPTNFETTLFFDYPSEGNGTLIFYNENASGEPSRDRTLSMPVKLAKSSAEKTVFNVYFGYPHDFEKSCEVVMPFKREVAKTQAVAKAAIEELLKGPSAAETYAGYATSINRGVQLQSLVIENGIARADFNSKLQEGVAGSCRVLAIRSEIEKTLKQFANVKSVVISVNGQTQEILQP